MKKIIDPPLNSKAVENTELYTHNMMTYCQIPRTYTVTQPYMYRPYPPSQHFSA
jgi:hypothetical protein